jgi:hypothetical protein
MIKYIKELFNAKSQLNLLNEQNETLTQANLQMDYVILSQRLENSALNNTILELRAKVDESFREGNHYKIVQHDALIEELRKLRELNKELSYNNERLHEESLKVFSKKKKK